MRTVLLAVLVSTLCACGDDGAASFDAGTRGDAAGLDAGRLDAGRLDAADLDAERRDAERRDAGAPAWDDVSAAVETVREAHGSIALGGAVVTGDGMIAAGVAGVRRRDGTEAVELDDRWHLGSDTKAMTATLAAILVEDGVIGWDTTVADAFPGFADRIDPAFATVTLVHLLTHRAGLTGDLIADDPDAWSRLWMNVGPLPDQRLWLAERLLTRAPSVAPGSAYVYSNAGYIVAGAMLEQATATAWEELMRDRLFAPLAMESCGFGAPGDASAVDEPWGHRGAALDPVAPGFTADNPPALGPAGTVHCPLDDWSAFVALHLRGARGDTELLTRASFERLHADPGFGSPSGFGYGYGWAVVSRSWAGGDALTHNGSNTMWLAVAWLAPARDRAYLAVTNQADDAASAGTDALIGALRSSYPPP